MKEKEVRKGTALAARCVYLGCVLDLPLKYG